MPRPRFERRSCAWALWGALATAEGCGGPPTIVVEDDEPADVMAVGESRTVELRFMRFDVEGYEKAHTLQDLRAMPRRVLADIWLVDLDITPLMQNALEKLRGLSHEEVQALPTPARNMHRLLTMTPDNAVLEGTNLEEMIELSAAVGIPPARALANLLGVGVTDDFIPPTQVAKTMLEHLVGTHPATQFRKGPVDEAHPDGLYPVANNAIPLTLADVVTNFEDMAERFGPSGDHPGFLVDARGVSVIEEDFVMVSKVDANALPYKGLDLTNASVASVDSTGSQIGTLHDFSDPEWMRIEGLVPEPKVEELTFRILENDAFIPGGLAREPVGQGDSPAWMLPPWEFEHLIVQMSRGLVDTVPAHCDSYELATGAVAFTACIDEDGWVVLETFNDIGSPPDPAYLWDLNLELAQVRMHDGGLAEGDADVELTVRDVPVGISPEELVAQVRANIQANPEALREFVSLITDSTVGDADFYYYRTEAGEDWLYFVTASDLRLDDDGDPVRPYAYPAPGFFADRGLTQKVSSTAEVEGDTEHEKVRVSPGDVLYVRDDQARTFELVVAPKTRRAHLGLVVTRLD